CLISQQLAAAVSGVAPSAGTSTAPTVVGVTTSISSVAASTARPAVMAITRRPTRPSWSIAFPPAPPRARRVVSSYGTGFALAPRRPRKRPVRPDGSTHSRPGDTPGKGRSYARSVVLVHQKTLSVVAIVDRPVARVPLVRRPPRDRSAPKVLLVCSSGGHLAQLHLLQPWWGELDRCWVTFD